MDSIPGGCPSQRAPCCWVGRCFTHLSLLLLEPCTLLRSHSQREDEGWEARHLWDAGKVTLSSSRVR